MLNKIMNKILGGTVNTTDNQVTAQVKAEPTVAKPATPSAEGEHKQTRRRTKHTPPCWRERTVNMQLVKVKAQHVNAVQILKQMQMVVVLIRHAVQIHVAMLSKVKVKNVQNVNLVKTRTPRGERSENTRNTRSNNGRNSQNRNNNRPNNRRPQTATIKRLLWNLVGRTPNGANKG